MTDVIDDPAAKPLRRWRFAAAGASAIVLMAAGSYVIYGHFRPAVSEPPRIDLAGCEPEVVRAVGSARAAVELNPRSADAWGRLGMVLHVHNFLPAAQPCFETAERFDPGNPKWPYLEAVNLLEDDPDPAAAEACLLRAVARSGGAALPGTASLPRLRLAELLVEQGRLDEAQRQTQAVLQTDAHNPRALLDAGRIELARGDLSTSLAHLTESAKRIPAARPAYALLAEVHHRLGNESEAGKARRRAASLSVHFRWPDHYLDETVKYWEGVLGDNFRAESLFESGRKIEAVRLLSKTVADHPDSLAAALTLGRYYRDSGDLEQAIEVLSAAANRHPDATEAHVALGKALTAQGRAVSAAESFQRAVDLKPDHVAAWHLLARARLAAGQSATAEQAFRECLRLGPGLASAHRELAELLLAAGRQAEAKPLLARAVELDPSDKRARKLLADL